jgi:hypothetical protein
MKHVFSINAEGGPLLCLDAHAATGWKGSEGEGTDYANLCATFDGQPELAATMLTVGEHSAVAWEMSGPGTAEVFKAAEGRIRIVRAWLHEDTPQEIQHLASAEASSHTDVGEIEISSGLLAVLWAPESGNKVLLSTERDVQRVAGTSIDGSALVMKVPSRRFWCEHDEVRVGVAHARRLTLIPR